MNRKSSAKTRSVNQNLVDFPENDSATTAAPEVTVVLGNSTARTMKFGVLLESGHHGSNDNASVANSTKTKLAPKLPHERDESINTAVAPAQEPMKQAVRDIKRGLVDTDRGPELGRTYRKLKQSR